MPGTEVNPMRDRTSSEFYEPAPRARAAHAEGSFTRVIEQQAAKIPSSVFLTAALASMALSAIVEFTGRRHYSRFIGMWAPTLLSMGIYNKLVKTLGTR